MQRCGAVGLGVGLSLCWSIIEHITDSSAFRALPARDQPSGSPRHFPDRMAPLDKFVKAKG